MINFDNVSLSFGNLKLLDGVSFTIEEGTRASLIGPGSSGKSTILKLLLGIMKPDAGKIQILGQDISNLSTKKHNELLAQVGMSFQQGGLFDFMTVRENLFFAMDNMTSMTGPDKDDKVETLLRQVKLPDTQNKFPFELSGGMQKRVSIARALCTDPSLAFFDEPTAGLDPVTSTIILNMIKDLGSLRPSNTLLVATSNVEIGIRFAERVIIINESKILADESWKELILNGSEWIKHFLSVRLIGLDESYARELDLPDKFIDMHWH